ncbi:DUF6906 family protein [Bacillus cereus]|uniref:DUF6906 family protein n=1 Tax=Bacillus cereus TaxID=1396 RepID=UPI003C2CD8D7
MKYLTNRYGLYFNKFRQDEFLKRTYLNTEEWLSYKKADGRLHLIHRHTNRVRIILSE